MLNHAVPLAEFCDVDAQEYAGFTRPVHAGKGCVEPLSRAFNIAVQTVAARLFPCGFDVSDDAPTTLKALNAHVKRTGRIVVSSAHSEHTIYADPEMNFAFRAWHDWHHWKGQHSFDEAGERAVFNAQYRDLELVYGREAAKQFRAILHAEVIGHLEHERKFGTFPRDQRGFVQAYMRNPAHTLNMFPAGW